MDIHYPNLLQQPLLFAIQCGTDCVVSDWIGDRHFCDHQSVSVPQFYIVRSDNLRLSS